MVQPELLAQGISGGLGGPGPKQRIDRIAEWGQLPPGAMVSKGAVLFPRLEEEPA